MSDRSHGSGDASENATARVQKDRFRYRCESCGVAGPWFESAADAHNDGVIHEGRFHARVFAIEHVVFFE
jgi:hypothetical protein